MSPRHFLSNGDAGWIAKNTCSNNDVLRFGIRPFLCKCPCRRVLVTCRSAFRPPRLAQRDVPSRRVRVSWDFSQRKVLFNVDAHFDYENLHKTGAPLLGRSIILITLCPKKMKCVHVHFGCAKSHTTRILAQTSWQQTKIGNCYKHLLPVSVT